MYLAIHLLTYIHTYIHMRLVIHLLTYVHTYKSCYTSLNTIYTYVSCYTSLNIYTYICILLYIS